MPGPQTLAYNHPADLLFFGGSAGGGKTDLLLGIALNHRRSLIFRRVFPSLRAIIDRSRMLYARDGATADGDSFNESLFRWKFQDGRSIRFGSIQHDKNVTDWQGQPHDLYGFDELPEFTENMFRFVTAWNRPMQQGTKIRCRIVATGNPPTTKEGEWVLDFFAPWLRDDHPNPAKPGDLRWFTNIDGKEIECPTGDPFMHKKSLIVPRSRTFIPASIKDNPFLLEAGYESMLQGLPEPLRSKLLHGDFKAGVKEDPWQLIPTDWIRKAQQRWENRPRPTDMPITQVGVDVSRGGNDRTISTERIGNYFCEQAIVQGVTTDDGIKVAQMIMAKQYPKSCQICLDAIGIGSSPIDLLRIAGLRPVSLIGSESSTAKDKTGQLSFFNKRSEWYWKLREALDPQSGQDLALPPDPELRADLSAPKWELTPRGIKVESKDDIKARLKRSPDKGDSVVYAMASSSGPGEGVLGYYAQEYDKLQAVREAQRNEDEAKSRR